MRVRCSRASSRRRAARQPCRKAHRSTTIARIVGRLHREVRYTGVEFGSARLIPEYPSETLRRRFGDCKDKSTLLVAALRASGIDAYLALLSAGDDQDVSADLPGLGMFNHAIVYVPGVTSAARICGSTPPPNTRAWARCPHRPPIAWRSSSARARASSRARRRMRSVDNRQVETREFFLAEYGPARVVETTETHGTIEGEYRTWYAGADTKARIDDLKTYMRDNYRGKELLSYEHTASDDFSKPYSMSIEMKDAPVGFTDLETSAVGINVANITSRLPEYFDSRLEDDRRRLKSATPAPRTWCSNPSSRSGSTASSRRRVFSRATCRRTM